MAQIGTIRLQTQNNGTVSVPVFDTGDSGSNVYEFVRVQTAGGTGFIPVVDPADASFPYLRVQSQNQGVVAVHNEASLQPAAGEARWLMNDGSGDATDSFNNFDLSLQGGASYSTTSVEGSHSLRFDRGSDEYAQTTTDAIWDNIASNNEFTFIGWVYPFIDDQQFAPIVLNSPPGGNWSLRFGINGGSGNSSTMFIELEGAGFNYDSSDRFDTNTWTHFAVTYDGSDITYYKGGNFFASSTLNVSIPNYSENMYLCSWSGGSNPDWYDGQLDAMDVYSRALTSTEVSNHQSTGDI